MAENKVLTLAKQYADAVRGIIDAEGIYLYGSQARGTATRYSDIDIAVIVNKKPDDYMDVVVQLWKLGRFVSDAIEPVLLSADDLDSGFLQTVRSTGIAV